MSSPESTGQVRTDQISSGQVRISQVWEGHVMSKLVQLGQVKSKFTKFVVSIFFLILGSNLGISAMLEILQTWNSSVALLNPTC